MSSPVRRRPLLSLDIRICRQEVRRALRELRAGGVSAVTCLGMLTALRDLDSPGGPADPQLVTGYMGKSWRAPFLRLFEAWVSSETRMGSMPKDAPERVVEENFAAICDIDSNKKLAEALPSLSESKLSQVRKRLSMSNKIIEAWCLAFTSECRVGPYDLGLSEDGQAVEVYRRKVRKKGR